MKPEDARKRGLDRGRRSRIISRAVTIRSRVETRAATGCRRRGLCSVVRCQPAYQQGHPRRHRSDLEADGFQEMRSQDRSGRMRAAPRHSSARRNCRPLCGDRRCRPDAKRAGRSEIADGDRACATGSENGSPTTARCVPILSSRRSSRTRLPLPALGQRQSLSVLPQTRIHQTFRRADD